jgi:hypothetical protein
MKTSLVRVSDEWKILLDGLSRETGLSVVSLTKIIAMSDRDRKMVVTNVNRKKTRVNLTVDNSFGDPDFGTIW